EGALRLCPQQGPEDRDLLLARTPDLRGVCRYLPARGPGRPELRRLGLRLREIRLVLLRPDRPGAHGAAVRRAAAGIRRGAEDSGRGTRGTGGKAAPVGRGERAAQGDRREAE